MATRIRKPATVIDREHEWEELVELWKSKRPELALLLGRRRAGKSFLLAHFLEALSQHREHPTPGFYYQATRETETEQLATLTRMVGEYFGDSGMALGLAIPSWEALFTYIARQVGQKPFMVVLDEFPYLSAAAPALPSILQKIWDHTLAKTHVKLLLSGSYISAMTALTAADAPLFGRRTSQIVCSSFTYAELAQVAPQYTPTDRLQAYGIFGGLPGNLSLLDPTQSLAANVARHVLRPNSRLYDEGAHLLDAFLAEAEVPYSIVDAIAHGERMFGKISSRVGRSGSALSRPLAWLQEMDIVQRVAPITPTGSINHKAAQYRLTDPYLRFWHRFVRPLQQTGRTTLASGQELWNEAIAPHLNDYMGEIFEDACRSFVRADRGRQLPFRPARVGAWWTPAADREIDIVALDASGQALLGECKWGHVTGADLDRLQENAQVFQKDFPSVTQLHYVLFSRHPIKDRVLARRIAQQEATHISLEAMYP